jgi:predicted ATPase/DNA-binding CsgD family transcriptional regulator
MNRVRTVGLSEDIEVTAREAEVLALIARHLTNAQIADALFISTRTVESHVSAMLRKLQLPDRRSLARHAETMPSSLVKSGRRALPLSVTPFIGRAAERAALTTALGEHRLVTATGPGGIGKTRLALSVAAELAPTRRDGVWFADLVHLTDPEMVTPAVAETIGVPEQRTTSIDLALIASLAESDALIVLDNCEHVLDGVRACVEMITARCPGVTVLATSRTRLLLPYERVYVVPGLSVVGGGGDAVDLFADRIAAAMGDSTPLDAGRVAALCQALDGIALAIELAAARFAALGLDGLESGLDQRLRVLTSGTRGSDRHSSLREAIGWSYDLLSPDDQLLLRQVAVFASWFDVSCLVPGAGRDRGRIADGLARLAEHSLLVVERGNPTRYRSLETIRQFGLEQLNHARELKQARDSHERWCRLVVDELRRVKIAHIDETWCERFDRVVDDVAAALTWCATDENRREEAASLAGEFAGLLFLRGRPAQAQRRYEQAADLAATPSERAAYLRLAAGSAASRYVGDEALRLFGMAADVAVSTGDRAEAVQDLATMAMYINRAPGIMATLHSRTEADVLLAKAGTLSDGSPLARAALAVAEFADVPALADSRRVVELTERAGDGVLHSIALDLLTLAHLVDNDIAGAVRVVHSRLELLSAVPVGPLSGFELGDGQLMAAEVDMDAGDLTGAAAHAEALARLPFYRDEDHVAMSRRILVDALAGHFDDVVRTGERFRIAWERAGRPVAPNLARTSYAVAMVYGMRGDDDRRATWVRVTHDLGVDADGLAGYQRGWAATFDALLALHRNDPAAAVRRLGTDLDDPGLFRSLGSRQWLPWYAALWAEAAVLDHHPDTAFRLERSRLVVRDNPIATAIVDRAAAIHAGEYGNLDRLATTFAQLGCPYQQERTSLLSLRPHQ